MSELKLNKSLEYLKQLKVGDVTYNSKIQRLYVQIYESKKLILEIESFADAYNFDKCTPENGFRSIIEVYLIAVKQAIEACDTPKGIWKLLKTRNGQIDDIQNFCEIIDNFLIMFRALIEFHARSLDHGSLISEAGTCDNLVMKTFKKINIASFYAQNIGFHMDTPTRFMSRQFNIAMMLYAEFFYSGRNLFWKILSVPFFAIKYLISDRSRALKTEELIRNGDIDFLKFFALFFASKYSCIIQNLFNHSLKVNRVMKIEPEPLKISANKSMIDVEIPNKFIGPRAITCHLYSATPRKGMVGVKSSVEPSKALIFHVHGGGFFAQSPRSHEVYLRDWAVKLDIPILSVKYSLTPRSPFPRALDEVFYVYCWLLKNFQLVGTTAENVILVGDSAGANLMTAMVVKCIECGVKVPKGIFSIYGLFLANYSSIPSMMLTFFDGYLHFGHMMRLFKTYAGYYKPELPSGIGVIPRAPKNEFEQLIPMNQLMSPILASKETLKKFPRTILLSTNIDPCLDENIEMGKKLRAAGVDVQVDVLHGLVHGFLHMARGCKRSYRGSMTCVQHILDLANDGNEK